jgi:hypothetical protein
MNVSACLVTRGDVDMQPILDSLPADWQKIIWNNRDGAWVQNRAGDDWGKLPGHDLSVYGRYAAIEYASHDLIYVQDDDVIVSDPQAIVSAWNRTALFTEDITSPFPGVVCNMPPEFRPHYPDSGLVGFGACFHRDAPERAFDRWRERGWRCPGCNGMRSALCGDCEGAAKDVASGEPFLRRADNVFTVLTPRVLVDIPKTDLPYASDPSRMWKQPGHTAERDRMIELARQVRDA